MNTQLNDLAKRPLRTVRTYAGYFVNGYKFHSMGHGTRRGTMNSGVASKGLTIVIIMGMTTMVGFRKL